MKKLVNTSMNQGQDPDEYFMEKTLARSELEEMGEPISDRRFKDVCVQGFTAEYKDIKLITYRDPPSTLTRCRAPCATCTLTTCHVTTEPRGRSLVVASP